MRKITEPGFIDFFLRPHPSCLIPPAFLRRYCSGEKAEGMTILFSWCTSFAPARPSFFATTEGGHTPAVVALFRVSTRSLSDEYGQMWRNWLSAPRSDFQTAVTGPILS